MTMLSVLTIMMKMMLTVLCNAAAAEAGVDVDELCMSVRIWVMRMTVPGLLLTFPLEKK